MTDGIQYFVGNGHPYPESDQKYHAATGAHFAHLLRDMMVDTAVGYINIPADVLATANLEATSFNAPAYKDWVRERVARARELFCEGKQYLDSLDVLRCKVVGHWYAARFEGVLDAIESDEFILRESYDDRKRLSAWLRMLWIWMRVSANHFLGWRSD